MSRRARQRAHARPWESNAEPNWTLLATLDGLTLEHRQTAELAPREVLPAQHQAAASRRPITTEGQRL